MATNFFTLHEFADIMTELAEEWDGEDVAVVIGDLTGDLSITRKSGYIQHGNVGYATEGFDPDSTPVMTLGDGDKRFYGTMLLPVSKLSEEAREAIEEREVAPDAD